MLESWDKLKETNTHVNTLITVKADDKYYLRIYIFPLFWYVEEHRPIPLIVPILSLFGCQSEKSQDQLKVKLTTGKHLIIDIKQKCSHSVWEAG